VSPSTVSNLNKKIYAKIEAWRNRLIEGEHPYGLRHIRPHDRVVS
jgi:transposase-like protein